MRLATPAACLLGVGVCTLLLVDEPPLPVNTVELAIVVPPPTVLSSIVPSIAVPPLPVPDPATSTLPSNADEPAEDGMEAWQPACET